MLGEAYSRGVVARLGGPRCPFSGGVATVRSDNPTSSISRLYPCVG